MLDIGAEKSVIVENPFAVSTVLRENLYAKVDSHAQRTRKLYVPEVSDMQRIFAEMARLPVGENFNPNPEQRIYLERMAVEMADHAMLIAYSGMRLRESWFATIADDRGDELDIHGTKSEAAARTIQINPALRAVLDRIKTRRIGPTTKLVITREPLKAMNRACVRLGLPRLTNHRLRHFFASVCISSGAPITVVASWLGHGDGGKLLLDTYSHLLRAQAAQAAQKLSFNAPRTAAQSNVG